MSADLLRRAAALMRERAGDAAIVAPPPWWSSGVWYHHFPVLDGAPNEVEAHPWPAVGYGSTGADVVGHNTHREISDHIASWHPDVALAVADWLDATARGVEREGLARARDTQAFVVARAYLGEDA